MSDDLQAGVHIGYPMYRNQIFSTHLPKRKV